MADAATETNSPTWPPSCAARRVPHSPLRNRRSSRSAALPGEHRAVEASFGQVFWAYEPVEGTAVAPHHVGVVVRVELGEQYPAQGLLLDAGVVPRRVAQSAA